MKLLQNIKRLMESIEDEKSDVVIDERCQDLVEKYSDISKEMLAGIINDVKERVCEDGEEVDIEDKEVVEENEETEEIKDDIEEVTEEDEEGFDDELVIRESDDDMEQIEELDASEDGEDLDVEDEEKEELEDDIEEVTEDDDDVSDFIDEDNEELDMVEGDEEIEDKEDIETEEKENMHEDNTGAKAAIANNQYKGTFSSDVDDLTDYLNDY